MAGFLREMKRKDKDGKEYSYWVVIKTYRDRKTKKVRHKILQTFGRLSKKEAEKVKDLIQLKELGKEALVTTWENIEPGDSYDFLPVMALVEMVN